MTKWTVKQSGAYKDAEEKISRIFGVSALAAAAMLNRGLRTVEAIEYYKNASVSELHPLKGIPAVQTAFKLIKAAAESKIPVTIYGDYDVDGVTSTVILCKGLRALGVEADYFIPDRHTDGYGLNSGAIKRIAEKGCKLLITCDNGIAAKNETDYAMALGMQVIIFDHHEPAYEEISGEKRYIIPSAQAVVDLKLNTVDYPYRELCAGGLCYKLIRELFEYMGVENTLDNELAVFAALATICDVVELKDENRIIAKRGLELINRSVDNMGLKSLVEINSLQDKTITEYTFGFIIGPCINAGGRLEAAALAAELFMTQDRERAKELAERLYDLNSMRKEITKQGFERLSQRADKTKDRVLVLYDEAIDESVAGIVAGRLKERYNKPSIVLTKVNEGAKGSGRSIDCYDMFAELSRCREVFTKFGGHKMAAGMSLPVENVPVLRQRLNEGCSLTPEEMEPKLIADKIITLKAADIFAARDMEMFKPYGSGNPEPLVGILGLKITSLRFFGSEKNIARLTLADSSHNRAAAVWFDGEAAAELINGFYGREAVDGDRNVNCSLEDIRVDIMANLRLDDYFKDNPRPQLVVRDMRVSR